MLRLQNITKDYKVADTKVRALKGINLSFRANEFVSILGPSGCGKTTLLNLIGGLDKYTSGDLFIGGKSTKDFIDKDWDVYRNRRVGFIFQSYNLIPHQTVLGNVELALTIAGLSKEERQEKARKSLEKVGLGDQCHKRPNQLSGGQCQRVAIARALVNDPEILLADEPTGALDTKTSVQIMDLVKEIAKERLVIMVTHNPELAEHYSTRIIKLLDGELIDDTNPFSEKDEINESTRAAAMKIVKEKEASAKGKTKNKEKAKMSFFTAFRLSLQNLFTKKRRTVMTAIAGSIGIIGISMVLSISFGINGFIDNMQNDMISGFPITISESDINYESLFSNMGMFGDEEVNAKFGNFVEIDPQMEKLKKMIEDLMDGMLVENEMTRDLIDYIADIESKYPGAVAAILYDYGIEVSNNIYTGFGDRETSLSGIKAIYGAILDKAGYGMYSYAINMVGGAFNQLPDTRDASVENYVLSQYNVLHSVQGSNGIAKAENELTIVLSSNRTIADIMLAQLGYYTQEEFIDIVRAIADEDYVRTFQPRDEISYEDIVGKTFKWYPNDAVFSKNASGIGPYPGSATMPFTYSPFTESGWAEEYKNDGAVTFKIVGVVEPKEGLNYGMLTSGFYFTTALSEHMVKYNYDSEVAQHLRVNEAAEFKAELAELGFTGEYIGYYFDYTFEGIPSETPSFALVRGAGGGIMSMMSGGTEITYTLREMGARVATDDNGNIIMYDSKGNVVQNGGSVFPIPSSISLFSASLDEKDNVLSYIHAWNKTDIPITLSDKFDGRVISAGRQEIKESDIMGMIMSMLSSMVNMITVALVGFTSLALVVSCVMIAIITYVSVVERIKEIGVIRSLGGRKRDVSNLFTAETLIIGLASGIVGIVITYLLSGIVNLAVKSAGIATIAVFPWWVALIMVGVSVGLTLISGLMPSMSAAKKDPVVALRTE